MEYTWYVCREGRHNFNKRKTSCITEQGIFYYKIGISITIDRQYYHVEQFAEIMEHRVIRRFCFIIAYRLLLPYHKCFRNSLSQVLCKKSLLKDFAGGTFKLWKVFQISFFKEHLQTPTSGGSHFALRHPTTVNDHKLI